MLQRSTGRLVLRWRRDAAASSSLGWRGWRQREPSYTVTGQQQEKTRLFLVGGTERPLGGTAPYLVAVTFGGRGPADARLLVGVA